MTTARLHRAELEPRMRGLIIALTLTISATVSAQVQMRPTEAPLVDATSEAWYQLREPLQFAGDLYYQAGAAVFFNGNVMVRTGHYNGVPIYADATLEPYSIVFVPIGRGLLQPYERLRQGDLAGTTGSRPPSFPVRLLPQARYTIANAIPPTALPLTIGAISAATPESAIQTGAAPTSVASTAAVAVPSVPTRVDAPPMVSLLRPESNDGLWVRFEDQKWVNSGAAVLLEPTAFVRVGDYAGFPVFKRRDATEDVIYLPTRAGLIAPYRRKV